MRNEERLERLFADAKEKYGMRYTGLKGKTDKEPRKLTSVCMRIKQMALHLEKVEQDGLYK